MGKLPASKLQSKGVQKYPKRNTSANPSQGGKNLSLYMNNGSFKMNKKSLRRRFSIAESSSSDSDNGSSGNNDDGDKGGDNVSDSQSDSSLTAVSDNAISDKSSIIFDDDKKNTSRKTSKYFGRGKGVGKGKSIKSFGKKGHRNLWADVEDDVEDDDDDDDDNDDNDDDDDDDDDDGDGDGDGGDIANDSDADDNYNGNVFYDQETFGSVGDDDNDSDDDDDDHDDDDDDDDDGSSSSDDDDIDFVKLQAQKKLRTATPVPESKESQPTKKRDSGSVPKPKFGRRRSEAALPEDINFSFEFDDNNDIAVEDDSDDDDIKNDNRKTPTTTKSETKPDPSANQNQLGPDLDLGNGEPSLTPHEEEDIGEEIGVPEFSNDNQFNELNLDFNNQLIQAPKFNYDDINSDDDYEIDDNELLATLQADNDLEEFGKSNLRGKRKGSLASMEDDEDDDYENDFLKEEEKFLVNEFENNEFDDEGPSGTFSDDGAQVNNNKRKDITSGSGAGYGDYGDFDDDGEDDDDFDDDDDEEEDFIDFTIQDDISEKAASPKKAKKPNHDSDDEDDSYLWNYFFSSDNDSEGDDYHQLTPHVLPSRKRKSHKKTRSITQPSETYDNFITGVSDDPGYDTSESTDIDLNIPSSTGNTAGSQKAKEVLSSKTADYRPPVLGTWVALESKPFGIIDGLSTRTLTGQPPNSLRQPDLRERQRPRKSVITATAPGATPHSDDSALGLDELLNISDLDYDDTNDVKIWRDFNNQKQRVPLGAFRNKTLLENSLNHTPTEPITSNVLYNHTSKTNNDFNQRRYSLSHHKGNNNGKPVRRKSSSVTTVPSKLKRRRASKVEAFSEGYRSTKSGLFSEQALVDVEEVLGDDNDIMALIKGL